MYIYSIRRCTGQVMNPISHVVHIGWHENGPIWLDQWVFLNQHKEHTGHRIRRALVYLYIRTVVHGRSLSNFYRVVDD